MSGGINFIQGNPAIAAQHEGNRERDRQRQSMLQAESAGQRNLMDAATAPYQMRQTQAQTSQAEDSARFSRATLGDRITRSNVQATQAELTGFYESMKLLEQGDAEGARFVAEHYGQQIPEGVFNNRALQRQLSAIADEAQTRYPSNPRKQQEFIQYAVQGLQDETEGASRATDPMYRYTVEGAPQADAGVGAGGRPLQFDRIMQAAVEIGYSPQEAFNIATRQDSGVSEIEIEKLAVQIANAEMPTSSIGVRPEQRRSRLEEIRQELRQNLRPQTTAPQQQGGGANMIAPDAMQAPAGRFGMAPAQQDQVRSRLRDIGEGLQRSDPADPPPAPQQGEPPLVTTREEAEALPPGTIFRTPDGRELIR